MADLPQIRIVTVVHDPAAEVKDIRLGVVVLNPSDDVLAEVQRLLETQAIIVIGGLGA